MLTGAQLSFVPAEGPASPPSCLATQARIQGRSSGRHVAPPGPSLVNYSRAPTSAAPLFERDAAESEKPRVLSLGVVGERMASRSDGGGGWGWQGRAFPPPTPHPLSLLWTWGIIGAKDGWRQQLLVPRCRSAPEVEPLISAQLCKATGWCPEAARIHTHAHACMQAQC